MNSSFCVVEGCCNECEPKRRYCREHYLERKRILAKQRYKEFGRYMYTNNCEACNKPFEGTRKAMRFCPECRDKINHTGYVKNNYETAGGKGYCWKHRRIAEEILNRKLNTNEVVHHLDNNGQNNELTNLIVISRTVHVKLHHYLNEQRVILEKSLNENFENCWKSLIAPITTTWLETTGVKVIRIWEIGKSAAEPLNEKSHEEGSETMYETLNSLAEGDDIVQTTTVTHSRCMRV